MIKILNREIYKAGDVIAVESTGIVALFIRRAQRRLGFKVSDARVSHVGIIINSRGDILEAHGGGIIRSNVSKYIKKGIKFHILRHKHHNIEYIADTAILLAKYEGRQVEYDYSLIAGLLLFSLGLPAWVFNLFNKKHRYICTEYVIEVYAKYNIIIPKTNKLYCPSQFMVWADEGFFDVII